MATEEQKRRQGHARRIEASMGARRDLLAEKGWNTMESSFGGPGRMKWWADADDGEDQSANSEGSPQIAPALGDWDESDSGFSWI